MLNTLLLFDQNWVSIMQDIAKNVFFSVVLKHFLPHSHSWLCRYCFHPSWLGGRAGGRAVAASLSRLDLCDHKLEEVQIWHRYSYHDVDDNLDPAFDHDPVTLNIKRVLKI